MTKRALCLCILAFTAGPLASCGGKTAPPDPRAVGISSFTTVAPAQTGEGALGPREPTTLRLAEGPAFVPTGPLSQLRAGTLFVLNDYRGLLAVDVASSPPRLLGQLELPGRPVALFVEGSTAYAVMAGVENVGSKVIAVDVTMPNAPTARATFRLAGDIIGARLRGALLDLVARGDGGTAAVAQAVPNVVVTVELAAAGVRELRRTEIPGPGWIDQVGFAEGAVYLALYGLHGWNGTACAPVANRDVPLGDAPEGCSKLVAVDLAPGVASAPIDVRGRVATAGLSHHEGVLRALLHPVLRTKSPDGPHHRDMLVTFRAGPAAALAPLATLVLPTGTLGSDAPAFRFVGNRAYVVTRQPNSPVAIVDLQHPESPVLGAPLPTPGQVQEIVSATPSRLLVHLREGTLGVMPCPTYHLAIYDTTDPAAPRVLGRLALGADVDTYGVRTGASNLVLLPYFTQAGAGEQMPRRGLQLVDLDLQAGTLAARGRSLLGTAAINEIIDDGAQLLTLSPEHLQALAIGNRDAPLPNGDLALAPWVQDVKFAAGKAITLVRETWSPRFELQVSADNLAAAAPASAVKFEGNPGQLFAADRFVYLFWGANGQDGRNQPRLDVLEVTNDGLVPRSSRALGADNLDFGPENSGEGSAAAGIRQIGQTTFLLPLRRLRAQDCSPGPGSTGPGASSPGSAGLCQPPLMAAPPVIPPPPATAIEESAEVQRDKAAAPCPAAAADYLVLDAANPDRPLLVSSIRLPEGGEQGPSVVAGTRVFLSQIEGLDSPDPRLAQVRHFVVPLDLGDTSRPILGPRVNVPGPFVAERADDQIWLTSELVSDATGKPTGVAIATLYHPAGSSRAYLQDRLRLEGGVSGPVADAGTAFATVDGALVAIDLRGPGAPAILSRTPVPGATTSGSGWSGGGLGGSAELAGAPSQPVVNAGIHQIVGGHAFVLRGGDEMLVYDVRDPVHPRLLEQRLSTPRGAHPVRLAPGNRAVVPRAELGVGIVAFGDAPALYAPASCQARAALASGALTAAASSVPRCATKADCRLINDIGFACVDCYWLIGGDATKAAVQAQASAINQICDGFFDAGCKVIASGCPPTSLNWECVQGQCVSP